MCLSQEYVKDATVEALQVKAADFIGPRIKELCDKQHLTKYRLSQMTGLTQTVLANIIKKKTIPTIPTLEKICLALNVSLAQFFAKGMNPPDLTSDQKELMKVWNELNQEDSDQLIKIIRTFQ